MAQAPNSPSQGDADPSMDDILASIRRILSDEEKAAKAQQPEDGVMMLDPSMMVDDNTPVEGLQHVPNLHAASEPEHHMQAHAPSPSPAAEQFGDATHLMIAGDPDVPPLAQPAPAPLRSPTASNETAHAADTLVAPEAAAMAASSVGNLMRTLVAERTAVVHRGGPSIEDVVREEIRPLLKGWLDTHLPPLVERLVRAEIERVVGRIGT